MKKIAPLLLLVLISACSGRDEDREMKSFIDTLMGKMTFEEKIGQTALYTSWRSETGPTMGHDVEQKLRKGEVGGIFNATTLDYIRDLQRIAVDSTRLGIPLLFGYDVIHGYRTTFPIPLAMSCSWDMMLIELAASDMAAEAASDGLNWAFAPMVDIARDPRWGRIAEGAGEDTYLGSQIARAQVRGIQGKDLADTLTMLACVKHFAAYGAAVAGRDYNSVDMSERQLRELYLPPYKAAVDEGCATIMTSFNDINGVPATANEWLLTSLLRGEWKFDGMTVTDYNSLLELIDHGVAADGLEATILAMHAGVDMDMASGAYADHLAAAVREGNNTGKIYGTKVSNADVDRACRRVLEAKYKLGLFEDPYRYINAERSDAMLRNPKLFSDARQVARNSVVLLKNDNDILPLSNDTRSIALIGPMASDKYNQLGTWHMGGSASTVTSIEEGMRARYPDVTANVANGCAFTGDDRSGFAEAIAAARRSEVILLCMGEAMAESGEAHSKSDISLAPAQKALIGELSRLGKPMILLLHSGRPMVISDIEPLCGAVLAVWHLGSEAGNAIADLLSGDHNPSGKLSATFPRNMGQIPIYYNYLPTGRPYSDTNTWTSRYIDSPNTPLYPFGYGLSYTKFDYSPVRLSSETMEWDDTISAEVTIKNSGDRDGEEIVQLYIRDIVASVSRPVKELKGFQKVTIKAGESKTVNFTIKLEDLSFYNAKLEWGAEPGDFYIFIGGNSDTDNVALLNLTR